MLTCPDCEHLIQRVAELEKENRLLHQQNHLLCQQNHVLLKRVEKIEARLAFYENAHTPPSQQRFFEKQEETKNIGLPGRPPGFDGVGRKTPVEIHERKILQPVATCPDCGCAVHVKRVRKRTLTRIVPGRVENVEYQIPQSYCENCGKSVEPIVSNALPNSRFDLTLALWIACLRMLGVSVDKTRFLLETDYSLHVSNATITNTCSKLAAFLQDDYEKLRSEVNHAKHLHADETSWPIKGLNAWAWEFITDKTAYYTVKRSRGQDVPAHVLNSFDGVLVTDFWSGYNALKCEKQKCWVHLQRELKKLLEGSSSREFKLFARRLLRLYAWAKSERNHGKKTRLFAEQRLRTLLSKNYVDRNCKRLVKRLRRHEQELFVFCARRGLKDNNNRAERGIRPAVVVRKNSFGSQSDRGADAFAEFMSFFQTAGLREENFYDYMQNLVDNRLQN